MGTQSRMPSIKILDDSFLSRPIVVSVPYVTACRILKSWFYACMSDESFLLLAMAMRQQAARIGVDDVRKILGFTEDDITILMRDPKLNLKPLGNSAQNAPKFFASAYILKLATNPDWLDKASNAIRRHHLQRRKLFNGVGQRQSNLQRKLHRNLQQPAFGEQ
jgi:hypothetical protein